MVDFVRKLGFFLYRQIWYSTYNNDSRQWCSTKTDPILSIWLVKSELRKVPRCNVEFNIRGDGRMPLGMVSFSHQIMNILNQQCRNSVALLALYRWQSCSLPISFLWKILLAVNSIVLCHTIYYTRAKLQLVSIVYGCTPQELPNSVEDEVLRVSNPLRKCETNPRLCVQTGCEKTQPTCFVRKVISQIFMHSFVIQKVTSTSH